MLPSAGRVVAATLCSLLLGAASAHAEVLSSVTNDAPGAGKLATALSDSGVYSGGASFLSVPPNTGATPNAIGSAKLGSFFPSQGRSSYAVLTTGKRQSLETTAPGYVAPTVGTDYAYAVPARAKDGASTNVRDASVLKVPVSAPAGANCLTFDFAMYSSEFPKFVNSAYNDAFVAEIDKSTWVVENSVLHPVTAPDNFAFDASGKAVSVNTTTFAQANASGTAYSSFGATPLLSASKQISPGQHDLYLSLFDNGDGLYDSAVFLDALRIGYVPNPAVNCKAGAQPVLYSASVTGGGTDYTGTPQSFAATAKTKDGAPVKSGSFIFTVTGANPKTATVPVDPATGTATYDTSAGNVGDDTISACYDADADQACEANASTTATAIAPPILSFGTPAPVKEGDSGTTMAFVPITLDKPSTRKVSVHYVASGDTATDAVDFSALNGTVTIPAGVTTASVAIPIYGDTLVEGDETIHVDFDQATPATLGQGVVTARSTITIADDDVPTYTVADVRAGEGDGHATLTITSSLNSQRGLKVAYETADGTATAPADYAGTSGTAMIAAGQTSTTVDVPIKQDDLVEGDETFGFSLPTISANAAPAAPKDPSATVTITDDDTSNVSVAPASASVNENAGSVALTVTSSAPATHDLTVDYATADGTATAGQDYTKSTGTLTIPAGKPSATIVVPVLDDTAIEPDETFTLTLTHPSAGAVIAAPTGTVTIVSDDVAAVVPTTPAPAQQAVLGEKVSSPPPSTAVVLCGQDLVLLDVVGSGGNVHVAGLAAVKYAGQKVTVLAGKKLVGTATVGPNGTFASDVPQPSAALRSSIRYTARVGKATSRALKLERKLVITKRSGIKISGRVTASSKDMPKKVTFYRRLTCTRQKQFASAKVSPSGQFTVTLARPVTGELFALFRVSAKIGNQQTFTLPIAIQ